MSETLILVFVNGRLVRESEAFAEYETGHYSHGCATVTLKQAVEEPIHIEALIYGPGGLLLTRLKWDKHSRLQPDLNDPNNRIYKLD